MIAQCETELVLVVTLTVTIAEFINLQRPVPRGRESQFILFDVFFDGSVAFGG
jgi:ketopantoate hydroxymethyltransferase